MVNIWPTYCRNMVNIAIVWAEICQRIPKFEIPYDQSGFALSICWNIEISRLIGIEIQYRHQSFWTRASIFLLAQISHYRCLCFPLDKNAYRFVRWLEDTKAQKSRLNYNGTADVGHTCNLHLRFSRSGFIMRSQVNNLDVSSIFEIYWGAFES